MHIDSYGEDSAGHRLERWGHHAPEILIASIGTVVIARLVPMPLTAQATLSFVLFAAVIVSWVALRRHDTRLCEQCVAAMPLNPSEHAARCGNRFKVAHLGGDRRYVIPYLVLLLVSNFATGPVGLFMWAGVQLTMIYLILSYSTHRRLQPWCPQCQGGGGDDREEPKTPTPLPENYLV